MRILFVSNVKREISIRSPCYDGHPIVSIFEIGIHIIYSRSKQNITFYVQKRVIIKYIFI